MDKNADSRKVVSKMQWQDGNTAGMLCYKTKGLSKNAQMSTF